MKRCSAETLAEVLYVKDTLVHDVVIAIYIIIPVISLVAFFDSGFEGSETRTVKNPRATHYKYILQW